MSRAFGEKLKSLIDLVDVTQKDLAQHIGVHQSLISKCKKGERHIPIGAFEKIPEVLKEMGEWREAYNEPWAELWLMYLQETTNGVKANTQNGISFELDSRYQNSIQPPSSNIVSTVASIQGERSICAKQMTNVEVDKLQREPLLSKVGLLTPPDTIQRLSTLLKEPYSLASIFLLIIIILLAIVTLPVPVSSALSTFVESKPQQPRTSNFSATIAGDSESEYSTTPAPTPAPRKKQIISDDAEAAISPSMKVKWDFEVDSDGWQAYSEPGAEHSIGVDNGALCSVIANPGKFAWDLTMRYDNISLSAQNIYQLAFDITTTVDRNISINLTEGNGGHIYSTHPLKMGTQSVQVEIQQNVSDPDASLAFWIGGQSPGEICVDNIVLSTVGTFKPRPDSGETRSAVPENLIPSADFSEGYVAKGWWVHEANGAAFEVSVRDGALCTTVRDPGNEILDLTIGRRGINLAAGNEYRLDFDVFSDGISSLRVYISDYSETLELAPDWSVASMDYVHVEGNSNKGIRLRFGGQPNGTLCFDNFLLVESAVEDG